MSRSLFLPTMLAALCAAAFAGTARVEDDELLRRADRVMQEAERQHLVNRRMDTSISDFKTIVTDLVSNELLKQGGGDQMDFAVEILGNLSEEHVPVAARHLEDARRQLLAMRPKLEDAGVEIDTIIKELDRLLARATSTQATEALRRELREIIEKQEQAKEKTKEWGKQQFQEPEKAEQQREELAEEQEQIAKQVEAFEQKLEEAKQAEQNPMQKLKLERADAEMDKADAQEKLEDAAKDITDKKPIEAVTQQEEALEALRKVEELLQPDAREADIEQKKELRDQLADIKEEQQELREKVEEATPEQFKQQQKENIAEQQELDNTLEEAQQNAPHDQNDPVNEAIKEADKAMEKIYGISLYFEDFGNDLDEFVGIDIGYNSPHDVTASRNCFFRLRQHNTVQASSAIIKAEGGSAANFLVQADTMANMCIANVTAIDGETLMGLFRVEIAGVEGYVPIFAAEPT